VKFRQNKQNYTQKQVTRSHLQISNVQEGKRPTFWEWLYCYISTVNRPISM